MISERATKEPCCDFDQHASWFVMFGYAGKRLMRLADKTQKARLSVQDEGFTGQPEDDSALPSV